ncbi:MAG: tripartite tricarboxylate transporter substrate binding protein [Alphaproteobacteria bacterium]|nr:tripartite tricarboxylate transporter substrate binding protein [Alphaproteobacteria bacterium]
MMRWISGFVVAALALLAGSAFAQAPYPAQPVKIIVPFIAGSAPDVAARVVSERLAAGLGQTFIVDNKPGASGNIGAEVAVRAPADGYTLLLLTGSHVINPHLYARIGYDPVKDFAPITIITRLPSLMVVPPSSPAKTVAEFIALAKAKPGRLNYGSGGVASLANLSASAFRLAADIDYVHVPYKGAPDIIRGLLGEQIDVGFPTMPTAMRLAQQGQLRPLAVTSAKRTAAMPDVPTILESMPNGFSQDAWLALAAPAGTHQAIIERLYGVLKEAAADPAFRAKLDSDGSEVVFNTPAEFKAMLPDEVEKYGQLIKRLGIKLE